MEGLNISEQREGAAHFAPPKGPPGDAPAPYEPLPPLPDGYVYLNRDVVLDHTRFVFGGWQVPGRALARLLGISPGPDSPPAAPATPGEQPRTRHQAAVEATLARIREELEQAESWSLSVEVEKTYGPDPSRCNAHGASAGKAAIRLDIERDKHRAGRPPNPPPPADPRRVVPGERKK